MFALSLSISGSQGGASQLAPSIISLSPAADAVGVPVDAQLILTFDMDVQAGVGGIEIYNFDDNLIESFDVTTGVVFDGDTVTVTQTDSMSFEQVYYVLIDATAIESLDGVPFVGISDKEVWSFETTAL